MLNNTVYGKSNTKYNIERHLYYVVKVFGHSEELTLKTKSLIIFKRNNVRVKA